MPRVPIVCVRGISDPATAYVVLCISLPWLPIAIEEQTFVMTATQRKPQPAEEPRVLTLLRKRIDKQGWELITPDWLGPDAEYTVRCPNGHESELAIELTFALHCTTCRQKGICSTLGGRQFGEAQKPVPIAPPDGLLEAVEALGGTFIARTYINKHRACWFSCKNGHAFKAAPKSVLNKTVWCPHCVDDKKPGKKLLKAVKARGGKLLLHTYSDLHTSCRFLCENEHVFRMTPADIVEHGAWCPTCTTPPPIHKTKLGLRQPGPKFLDRTKAEGLTIESYGSVTSPCTLRCAKGHRFTATPRGIMNDTRNACPECRPRKPGETVIAPTARLLNTVAARGGTLIVDSYRGWTEPCDFQCAEGHSFTRKAQHIIAGYWCPSCSRRQKRTTRLMENGWIVVGGDAGGDDPIDVVCSAGHTIRRRPASLMLGRCNACSKRASDATTRDIGRSLGFTHVARLDKGRGNIHAWVCRKGHHFESTLARLYRGSCKECRRRTS
jgi:hypothetical protein